MARKIVVAKSKSEMARELFAAGKSVADTAREIGIGYAFAYGIAKRAGVAETAANRRPTRAVTVRNGIVIVAVAGPGNTRFVRVYPDGRVVRSRTFPAE